MTEYQNHTTVENQPADDETSFSAKLNTILDSHKTLAGKRKVKFRMEEEQQISKEIVDLWLKISVAQQISLGDLFQSTPSYLLTGVAKEILFREMDGKIGYTNF